MRREGRGRGGGGEGGMGEGRGGREGGWKRWRRKEELKVGEEGGVDDL